MSRQIDASECLNVPEPVAYGVAELAEHRRAREVRGVLNGKGRYPLLIIATVARWVAPFGARRPVRAVLNDAGYQEARVTIKGRYEPDVVEVLQGVPARLRFFRNEDDPCSERVIFAGIGLERRLPAFKETTIEFVPETCGTFLFTCHMGMFRGKLVVRPRTGRVKRRAG